MTPLLVALILLVVTLVCAFVGFAWFAVPLAVLTIIAFVWAGFSFVRGDRTLGDRRVPETHRTRKPELLGPGGPDDPDRAA